MKNYFIVFVLISIASYLYLIIANKYNIIDKPNQRSSHTKITIRGGGIVFVFALVLFWFFNNFQYSYFILGAVVLAIISFLDDIYTLSSKIRFSFQLIAFVLLLYQASLPFQPIPMYFLYLFTGLGLLNVINFMDGVNGITGLYALTCLLSLWMVNAHENLFNQDLVIYAIISVVIFGFYNFRKKALFFAGDIGSISIGLILIFLVFKCIIDLNAPIFVLFFAMYGADGGYTMLYRKFFTKEKWTEPHRHHIYQKLVDIKKYSHLKVASVYAIIQLGINLMILKLYTLPYLTQWILNITVLFLFLLLYIVSFKKLLKLKQENS